MSKLFFDDLLPLTEIQALLDAHELDSEERQELLNLVDEIYLHHALNVILNHLPKTHHEEFIQRVTTDPGDLAHWSFIQEKIEVDIKVELQNHLSRVTDDIKKDISKAKSSRSKKH